MLSSDFHVHVTNCGDIFTSPTSDSLPYSLPPTVSDKVSIRNLRRPLWFQKKCPFLAYVPARMEYKGVLFERLAYSARTLPLERTEDGHYCLSADLAKRWKSLEGTLSLIIDNLTKTTHHTTSPRYSFPRRLGYRNAHPTEETARASIMRSRDSFLLLIAMGSFAISRHSTEGERNSQKPKWMQSLQDVVHPQYLDEIRLSAVGDFTIPRVGTFMKAEECDSQQVRIMIRHNVPVWIYWGSTFPLPDPIQDSLVIDWRPSPYQVETTKLRLDTPESQLLLADRQYLPFPPLPRYSRQRSGETWREYFKRIENQNEKFRLENETPEARERRCQREAASASHQVPGKRGAQVFHWEAVDGRHRIRTQVPRTSVEDMFTLYGNGQRRFNSFFNEWDVCSEFDPTEISDDLRDDWEEDTEDESFFVIDMSISVPRFPADGSPPPTTVNPSVSVQEVENTLPSASSQLPADSNLNAFRSDLQAAFQAETTPNPSEGSILLPDDLPDILYHRYGVMDEPSEVENTSAFQLTWHRTRMIFGDIESKLDPNDLKRWHGPAISMVKYVSPKSSELHSPPPPPPRDFDDAETMALIFNSGNVVTTRFRAGEWVLKGISPASSMDWNIVVDAATAIQCLRDQWGPTDANIVTNLLRRGITFHTLLLSPSQRQITTIPETRGLGWRTINYAPDAFEYAAYERQRDEFLHGPRGRAALMSGGIVWRLAVDSLGINNDVVLAGPSNEAQPYGDESAVPVMLDDCLTVEECNLICGVYQVACASSNLLNMKWPLTPLPSSSISQSDC
jgi:hypothetical protein